MTKHHAELNINMKPSFNDTIALFGTKSNNRRHGQFVYDMTWFCFCFDFFVHMHRVVLSLEFVYVFKL